MPTVATVQLPADFAPRIAQTGRGVVKLGRPESRSHRRHT
jgi:hypothetical protein